jgi:biopolymer transport protein ExbB/TolQ
MMMTLSPVEFFLAASTVGKVVMLLLLAASIWCWVLITEGVIGVVRLRSALRQWRGGEEPELLAAVIEAGHEASRLHLPDESAAEGRHRMVEAMNRLARMTMARIEGGLTNLAVIASVTPFVGLLGTVWGIITSFSSIAAAKDTSLAVVAPGIAEALSTTAFGLFAAIPASIAYSRIGAALAAGAANLGIQIEREALRASIQLHDGAVREHVPTRLKEVV